jgi:hypothetical protein
MAKICEPHKKENHKNHVHALHKSEEGKHAPHTSEDVDDPCPYCADDEDNRTDDCQYCADLDAEENADGTAGMHDCDMCRDYDDSQQNIGGVDGCPMCEDTPIGMAGTPSEQGAEDHHLCNCPSCPTNDQTGLAVEDMTADRPDDCQECQKLYGDAVENQPGQTGQEDPNLQGHETAEEVLDLLDQEPGTGEITPEQGAKQIDNTEMPQGDQMKENTSVKENFGPAQKKEVSDSEAAFGQDDQAGDACDCPNCPQGGDHSQDEVGDPASDPSAEDPNDQPNMTEVLQSGLDEHQDAQKRQEVISMVAQTLQGFKANKASLEATKEQNQGLYNSCIQMLKSMVSLCDLLGLKPDMSAQSGQDSSATPPKKAAPSEGKSEAPKAPGQE